ncbi:MAG: hypothetical protein J3K34DRAFT_523795 [Monoraphidium minutum]|nr:MAG: hypothetical protein J3K34DRAFT_523795 [Monoraphidium minutum]
MGRNKDKDAPQAGDAPPAADGAAVPQPTIGFMLASELLFAAAVAFPIGMLAITDQHLMTKPFTYTGTELGPAYVNKTVSIEYCMWSPMTFEQSNGTGARIRCHLAIAAPAASLAVTFAAFMLRQRANRNARRIGNLNITFAGLLWWLAVAVVFSVWAHQSNRAGNPGFDWRNVYCLFAWILVLTFAASTCTALIMLSGRLQRKLFTPRPPKAKKQKHGAPAPASGPAPVPGPAGGAPQPAPHAPAAAGGAPHAPAGGGAPSGRASPAPSGGGVAPEAAAAAAAAEPTNPFLGGPNADERA